MSSLVNKVKEALHSDNKTEQPEGTHGSHNSRVANAADPRIDSDRDHRAAQSHNLAGTGDYSSGGQYTTTGTSTQTGAHTGAHTGTNVGHSGPGPAPNTAGPYKSDLLNKADPRVDSDRDHSRNLGMNPSGSAGTGTHNAPGNTASSGGAFFSGGHSSAQGTSGPHSSRLANTADPRIDSDVGGGRMGSRTTGTTGTTGMTGMTGMTGTHQGTTTGAPEGTYGPHSSRLANTADPRIDSDRDGGHVGSRPVTGAYGTHNTTSGAPEGTHGPHSSRMANAADPRVDSDRDGGHTGSRTTGAYTGTHTGTHTGAQTGTHTGTHTGAHTGGYSSTGTGTHHSGPGPAPNTAGPHKSDLMNKLDPRVDSNLDGSKTTGREKTFDQSGSSLAGRGGSLGGRDPTDAAQVPPSVMQKHIGPPVVEHDDHHHDRENRHSVSHQEQHRGL